MAATEEWFVGEDGCISVGEPTASVTYHSSLNTIIVVTKEPSLKVIDVTSGSLLQKSNLSACKSEAIKCMYLKDRLVFWDEHRVGVRKDLSGVMLLDTALQSPICKTEDVVRVELPLAEATHLFKCLVNSELPGVDYVEEVLKELEKGIDAAQEATKGNHKTAKWATVTLKLPHCAIKSVCGSVVMEMKRLHQHSPGLPVASSVNDRLSYLLPSTLPDITAGNVDRALMFSEAARRATFSKWPHMNYKWALPEPMAQAGFYHQPNSLGDDRAMCFTCNVCLVCWEPTDEPWSEHERHSPSCPFVKGEYTQNVPLSVTYATQPAALHGDCSDKIECLSSTNSENYVASSTLNGNIVIWSIGHILKKHCQFNIDPSDNIIAVKTGLQRDGEEAVTTKPSGGASSLQKSPSPTSPESVSIEESEPLASQDLDILPSFSNAIHDIPLHQDLLKESQPQRRTRPSQDVRVQSLCVVDRQAVEKGDSTSDKSSMSSVPSSSTAPVSSASAASSVSASQSKGGNSLPCPSLVCGVALRTGKFLFTDSDDGENRQDSLKTDVQLMNKVNEVVSTDDPPQIITDSQDASEECQSDMCSFSPYLLVVPIRPEDSRNRLGGIVGEYPIKSLNNATNVLPLHNCTLKDDWGPLDSMYESDPDVQIVGFTPAPGKTTFSNSVSDLQKVTQNSLVNGILDDEKEEHMKELEQESSLINVESKPLPVPRGCGPIQCIEVPSCCQHEALVIHDIIPTIDNSSVVVVLAPKDVLDSSNCTDSRHNGCLKKQSETPSELGTDASSTENSNFAPAKGGYILIYRLKVIGEFIGLEETPTAVKEIDNVADAITSILTLPLEFTLLSEEEETPTESEASMALGQAQSLCTGTVGQVAITTASGNVHIINLFNLTVVGRISPMEGDLFVSLAYCSGMERLCAASSSGKLHFYQISQHNPEFSERDNITPTSGDKLPEDVTSYGPEKNIRSEEQAELTPHKSTGSDILAKLPLTTDSLIQLHDLIQFDNLMPRFSATVPPCWAEIQQEQQQRRHPQHLQHQGEATQHTRTWKLQTDSNTWDEHLIELVLPRPCYVGHVDIKFSLHSMCVSPPKVEVTLLKQNISNIGRQSSSMSAKSQSTLDTMNANTSSKDVHQGVNFNAFLPNDTSSKNSKQEPAPVNNVLDPAFLELHNAEILCGPVTMSSCLDLSGTSGIISLTSPQLFSCKPRSFLIHIKALASKNGEKEEKPKVPRESKKKSSSSGSSGSLDKQRSKTIKALFENIPYTSPGLSAIERLAATAPKNKVQVENMRGCDYIQEISITVRKCKKTNVPKERLQRCAMLDVSAFHKRLMAVTCTQDSSMDVTTSWDHCQNLALDILSWITAIRMNDPDKSDKRKHIVVLIQRSLTDLVKACFISGTRATAHKCARLIALCIEYTKNSPDIDLAPTFSYVLLNSLLDCLPLLPYSYSAGGLKWYFTLLNRAKCMNIGSVAEKCVAMLTCVAKQFSDRAIPTHSLLKTRYGLYGHPFEMDLFDTDPPPTVKVSSTSYASIVGNNITSNVNTSTVSHGQDEIDFRDLFMSIPDKNSTKSQYDYLNNTVLGLLEVEPLHFTCHSTSDGTRMERLDVPSINQTANAANTSVLSGTINFGEGLSTGGAAGAAMGVVLSSLSSAMTTAEQQLQQLQSQQYQLMKLQQQKQKLEQKLAETTKTSGPGSVYACELFPPTPKTTPLFMTPPVTPPNESWQQGVLSYGPPVDMDPGKPPLPKGLNKLTGKYDVLPSSSKSTMSIPQTQNLLQTPAPQVLVIERMHSGARRFVTLDFGKPILLTDLIIPACLDLASLSIDVWIQGEEVDGQRLVVASDIGMKSLTMNNIMPPPICRFLKITTIGRYGGSTTRSRIPIGSFYGHSYILPWEWNGYVQNLNAPNTSNVLGPIVINEQPQLLSQLSILVSLQEDIQCRYSLAKARLETLLGGLDSSQHATSHTQYFLKKVNKNNDEDNLVVQAYHDCLQLQLQFNLAQRAIHRLRRAFGVQPVHMASHVSLPTLLKQTGTDKLRFILERLVDTLLGMTIVSPSIPILPMSLYTALNPVVCESLFRHLCVVGGKHMQVHTGMLLVRICGSQPWWGEFLGNVLQEFFNSEQSQLFPRDRVFILITALGQRSLMGPSACNIMESLLGILATILSPLIPSSQNSRHQAAWLDLSLIGWILLFLCRNLDNGWSILTNTEEEKAAASSSSNRDNGSSMQNRWSFIQGESGLASSKPKWCRRPAKRYRNSLQKRLMYHKQKLIDLDQTKKKFYEKSSSSSVSKEAQSVMKQQEQLFKKEFSQYASKHLKDIVQIRRTDGDILKKLPKDDNNGNGSRDGDNDSDLPLILPREKCLPVVRGLMSLILSMDFTCNVDLFLIASKVFARICIATRPAISLSEAMTQDQLERLVMLSANFEFNHGNVSWGGPWAGHAITCLLQDILDGERLYPPGVGFEGVTDDEISSTMTETDDSLPNSVSLPTIEETVQDISDMDVTGREFMDVTAGKDFTPKTPTDKHANLMDMAYGSDEGEYDDVPPPNVTLPEPTSDENVYQIVFGPSNTGKNMQLMNAISVALTCPEEKKKLDHWKTKVADYLTHKPSGSQGTSTAMDARLECGLDTQPELRLKMMTSVLTESIHCALTSALPLAPPTGHSISQSKPPTTDEEQLSEASFMASLNMEQGKASCEMLSLCFDSLFAQLLQQRVNLDSLLQLWLTLNEDSVTSDDGSNTSFDPSRTPSIPLNQTSVTSLLAALAWTPNIPVSSWVLAFHVLTLLCNQRSPAPSGSEISMASVIVSDSNLSPVLMKFLSGMVLTGPGSASYQSTQVGPSATKAFYEFLSRLYVKIANENEQSLKELLLKVVYNLTADRGAFCGGLGPLDAQCRFLDFVLDLMTFHEVEISNAISVIESISSLVHQHILNQERVTCKSSSETSVNARSCFGGMFASLLRANDSRSSVGNSSRDILMCSLLKLVNSLIQIKLPSRYGRSAPVSTTTETITEPRTPASLSESMTDTSKLSQALATSTPMPTINMSKSDEEKVTDQRRVDSTTGSSSTNTPASSRQSQADQRPSGTDNRDVFLAEIILGHTTIMSNLIQALSYCNSNTMAMIIGSSGLSGNMQETVTNSDPLSVGDGIYQILCTLRNPKAKQCTDNKLILEPIHAYLSGCQRGYGALARLSEPLIWFILKILDSVKTIQDFLNMGGIEVICQNLVSCNQRIISSNPSLISTIMHHLSNSKLTLNDSRKTTEAESIEGWHNFAPLGTITSSSPTASPADVLIQASPPHRRARSAAWSYHFYPDEAWVDLTIQLPFAVLLKEVQIQPHLTSLATCPAFVSIEISRDGSTVTPLCPPLMTSSLAFIKLQLQKPEIATSVTIRLHKARDSTTIGLSQVLLMGYSAFGESGYKTGNIFLPTEDLVSRTSFGWLRLLHHCLTAHDDVTDQVAASAALVPNLITTCMALLVSPAAGIYATNMEAVLLKIGLHSAEMGLTLIDNILKNVSTLQETVTTVPYLGKVNGIANDSTIEILYRLGITEDESSVDRIRALAEWIGDSARLALRRNSVFSELNFFAQPSHLEPLPNPAPAHIHCIGAILWQRRDHLQENTLREIITKDLVSSIYNWSMALAPDSSLKRTVDFVLCSLCYIRPDFFTLVLKWIGVISDHNSVNQSITDDSKDHNSLYEGVQSLTDDVKEEQSVSGSQPIREDPQLNFSHMVLQESHLKTLATACKSPTAIKQLLDTGFPAMLSQGLFEFCSCEMQLLHTDHPSPTEGMTDQSKTMNEPGRDAAKNRHQTNHVLTISTDLVAAVLSFFAEMSSETVMKDWLGGPEGNIFWPALLTMLCNTLPPQPTNNHTLPHKHKATSVEERGAMETAAVSLFSRVIFCHTANQHLFAKVLCDVIKGQGEVNTGVITSASPLSGFTRRLFLQVLLEDEKLLVAIQTTSKQFRWEINKINSHIQHPKYGAGRLYRTMMTSLQSTCGQLIAKVSDTPTLTASIMEQQEKKQSEDPKKDTGELGMEVVEYLSTAAGVSAKEKRDKSSVNKSLPPRPPSRRGRHKAGTLAAELIIPSLSLHHDLLHKQPLPSELTLSQLLTLLYQHGLAQGCSSLEFAMKLSRKKMAGQTQPSASLSSDMESSDSEETDSDRLPDNVLLDTPSCQSALHVFASVGGLALLAEHLPLLYPEITRQSTVGETENNTPADMISSDWVTVEPTDDYYESFYEPMSPGPQSNPRPSKPQTTALPTIPPHSLVAFGLFLRLPGYAEVLLKERKKAQCLLRLVLGVTDDGDGGHILTSPIASSLPTLPFHVLKTLFDVTAPSTDDGVLLRRMTLEIGALHLILACLSVLSHHAPRSSPSVQSESVSTANTANTPVTEEKTHHYWAKGTGFGTGSTTSSWDAEQALLRQKSEEEHVTCLLQVLGSYINSGVEIPKDFQATLSTEQAEDERSCLPSVVPDLLTQSCLVPAICSYLRNDSVLDMARHVPLYRALLELLRGLAVCSPLVPLLMPLDKDDSASSIGVLLEKMKGCVDTYASRLKSNKSKGGNNVNPEEEEENEGLALLIPDIQETAKIVQMATDRLKVNSDGLTDCGSDSAHKSSSKHRRNETADERYMNTMKSLQFDTYEMVLDEGSAVKFTLTHHYESNVKSAGEVNNPARARRLAQEAVTLSTSLPLSASSSVFVRCDEERLDVMKVLITGPSDTPYANGAFEFDVYFPQDYPVSPPNINLETTGNHTVRFNPNLYNDGKVCLSVLNTWHGRPEEKWNAQTSSFLQVLVSIQSLILVNEPYFNEPGYERSRGTPPGTASSREYDANIRQATVKWGMLEQLRNPSPCFKEVVQKHFWLKRHEVLRQCEEWISEMEGYTGDKRTGRSISHSILALKRHYNQLREELAKLKAPTDLEEEDPECDPIDPREKQYSTSEQASGATGAEATPKETSNTSATLQPLFPYPIPPPDFEGPLDALGFMEDVMDC